MSESGIEILRVGPKLLAPLKALFGGLCGSPDERWFHPHPFTSAEAERIALRPGRDLYYLLLEGSSALAYGLLRGWEEGFDVPSLGLYVRPDCRGRRLGELMMHFLHAAAARRGAPRVRLKVYPDNAAAIRLYTRLGYVFQGPTDDGQLLAFLDLPGPAGAGGDGD